MNIHKIKSELKIILSAIIIGVIVTASYTLQAYSTETVNSISNKIVRFRVLANSNKDYDQALKLIVKDSVINHFESDIKGFTNKNDALYTFNSKLDEIEAYATNIVKSYGYNYRVTAKIEKSTFPTRHYGNISLPSGEYTTLVIEIGNSLGDNWWCVMYPPLCFIDETIETIPTELDNELQTALHHDEYNLIAKDELQYNVKFKIVEIFN